MPHLITDYRLAQIRRANGEPALPLPAKPRKRDNEESRIQCALIIWWHHACAGFGVPEITLFAVGNGGARSPVTGAIMKREGVRRGTSDLLLMARRGTYGALALEMKKPDGVLSSEQRDFLRAMNAQGYRAVVAYSFDEAVNIITEYLAL